jgi:riboflavin kinase/FMN adenylyltransferase
MRLIRSAGDLKPGTRPVFLAIGVFDGVHLGHQQIIHETVSAANLRHAISLVITFDNHPNVVVAPERVPPLIYSLPQKLRTIESMGVEALLLVHFDQPFSQTTGEEFMRGLAHDLGHIGSVCVGADFTFGHKRSGDVRLLKKMGAELNFDVHAQPAVLLDGKAVSSTRIREVIRAGDLETASRMLGRTYALSGEVIRGDGLGRQLGFPTANLDTTGLVLPPGGVYAAYALLEGARHPAVLNIGYRPTVHDVKPQLRVEAHLLDFEGDLYGKTLDVVFMGRLRDEKKFGSLDELRAQIAQDIAAARKRL